MWHCDCNGFVTIKKALRNLKRHNLGQHGFVREGYWDWQPKRPAPDLLQQFRSKLRRVRATERPGGNDKYFCRHKMEEPRFANKSFTITNN